MNPDNDQSKEDTSFSANFTLISPFTPDSVLSLTAPKFREKCPGWTSGVILESVVAHYVLPEWPFKCKTPKGMEQSECKTGGGLTPAIQTARYPRERGFGRHRADTERPWKFGVNI